MKKQLVYLLTGWLMCGMGLQARAQVEPLFTYKLVVMRLATAGWSHK